MEEEEEEEDDDDNDECSANVVYTFQVKGSTVA